MHVRSQTRSKTLRLLFVLVLHLAGLYGFMLNSSSRSLPGTTSERLDKSTPMSIVFIKTPVVKIQKPEKDNSVTNKQTNHPQLSKKNQVKQNQLEAISVPPTDAQKPAVDTAIANEPPENSTKASLNRDVNAISKLMERDLRFEQQKIEAAKPPNQIAREYWQKQNNPYKDKWEELAHKIEKAGTPRGLQMETFKAVDGTQITKLGDRCFKAPDPGRTYLHQAEARRVICPR
jgi:hypothetical protein